MKADEQLTIVNHERDADVLIYDRLIRFDRAFGAREPKRVLMYDERKPENPSAALHFGFDGAIARDASPRELRLALLAVSAGYLVFSHAALSNFSATEERETHQPLTEREIEVLRLMGSGKSNKAIGEALNVSEHMAKSHVGSILSKLRADTRTNAVRIGIKLGLIPL